jgi:glycosyltransferase involved in cell wall biosynthesis
MDSISAYLPYTVGIARWVIFLSLKAVPAMFYHPYTSKTLQRDAKRHAMLMKRGWYLRFRNGTLSGLVSGLIGLALANLSAWLIDEAAYHRLSAIEKIIQSLIIGFIPGFFAAFSFAVIIESVNIRVRKKFMRSLVIRDILVHDGCNRKSIEDDLDCLIEPVLFTPSDVTVVVPVYQPPPSFKANMASLIQNGPAKIFIVADITCERKIHDIVDTLNCDHGLIEIIPEPRPGKRAALSMGLMAVQTRLTCFVDDDCQWCSDDFLKQLIKPFNNRTIGAVGSKQIMRPSEKAPKEEGGDPIFRRAKILEIMADFRLSVRYIDLMATTAVDRGASCVSGRTMCFRTEAIAEDAFHSAFLNETLLGIHLLSGDDKFLTRYVINKGYKTYHQLQPKCVLTTTFESRPKKHLSQLVRWSRNTWRSDIIALFIERQIWLHNPFTAFLLFDKLFTPFFLFYGFVLIPVYSLMRMDYFIFVGWIGWLHFSRFLKLVLHFKRKPGHIIFLPIWIFYQYLMAFVRIYALITMLQTKWGNRDVKVVNNQVTRTGEFARHVTGAIQVTPQESESEHGNDDDVVFVNGDDYEVCYRGDEELDDWEGPCA